MHARHQFALIIVLATGLAGTGTTPAEEWPKGYIVAEGSESPDGNYAILHESKASVLGEEESTDQTTPAPTLASTPTATATPSPSAAAATSGEDDAGDGYVNYFVNLKAHRVLGKIKDSDYFQGQNHAGFSAQWSPDSKLCVAEYDARYGFYLIVVLEPNGDRFNQVEVGGNVHKVANAATKKAGGNGVDLQPYFRFAAGGKIQVRAFGQDNPKQLDPDTHYIFFRGTYDYPAKKWVTAEARSITSELADELQYAFNDRFEKEIFVGENPPDDFRGQIVATEQDKFDLLDATLNHTYQALRMMLPAAQFAKIKADEKEWVKKLEGTKSAPEKSVMIIERIKKLQDYLWQ